MIKLQAIKTKQGFYLKSNDSRQYLNYYFINGVNPEKTVYGDWFYVEGNQIESLKNVLPKKQSNHRYVLVDSSLENEKIPLQIKREDACFYDDEEESWVWKFENQHLKSLYKLEWDTEEESYEDIPCEVNVILEIDTDKLSRPEFFQMKNRFGYINALEPEHEMISKLLFPAPVVQFTPCKYSSNQMYEIVRDYVKRNYDRDWATISSDYDFCFQVNKKIKLSNPHEQTWEIMKENGKPYKQKKFKSKYISTKEIKVFEMTNSKSRYKGYTVIPEMIADNEEELVRKVNDFCETLIARINEPLVECGVCQGSGVILETESGNK